MKHYIKCKHPVSLKTVLALWYVVWSRLKTQSKEDTCCIFPVQMQGSTRHEAHSLTLNDGICHSLKDMIEACNCEHDAPLMF